MKWTIAGLILAGIVAAFCAAMLVASLRSSNKTASVDTVAAPTEVEVLVAARKMPAMAIVDAGAIKTRTVKSDEVTEGTRLRYTDIVGQVLITPLVEGEVFHNRNFASRDSGIHLASTLPEGLRAMSAMLEDDTGIIDILYPGCVVDVIASFRLPSADGIASGEVLSATVLQGVQVLAIGNDTVVTGEADSDSVLTPSVDRKQRRRVTFKVDQDQAEVLQLATAHGKITVVMRNPLDVAKSEERGVLLTDLSQNLAGRIDQMTAPDAVSAPMTVQARNSAVEPKKRAKDAVWTTVVMRGLDPETCTFPIKRVD